MSQTKETSANQPRKTQTNNNTVVAIKKGTQMIVERVNRMPVINSALAMGFTQYDRLKSSNATVGQVITRAEGLAVYFWTKVQPIVEKLQDRICATIQERMP